MSRLNWTKRAYGVFLLCATTAIALPAQTFTTLHSFDGTDGANPAAVLIQATNGYLYGTTYAGGANNDGTVFKISPSGTLTTLHSFDYTDGEEPNGGLVQATDGNFYGTTYAGGANNDGTVFKISPSGTLTTLHSFAGYPTDGSDPTAALVQATDGNLYGTTLQGGAGNDGTVFKVTAGGALTTLYNFCSQSACTDGSSPYAVLIQATDGNFYGTTFEAGGVAGEGTVFKITPRGALTTLYSFCSQTACTDGAQPLAGLVQATDGNFYGTTTYGGANGGGTVFKITPSGTLTTLYGFCSQSACTDGTRPVAGLVQATDGNFYGTTGGGGANSTCPNNVWGVGCGTVFKISPSGTLTTLHSFDGTDGSGPTAGLAQDTNGKFYGTTFTGGTSSASCSAYGSCGTVFSLSVGLSPFVETEPTSGKVGALVKILGTNLTGTTSVTFNGTSAAFTVVSRSEITTTVPSGATTGKVQVTVSGHTLTSNVNFRVP